ncbi:MAG TPA: HD domain-containing phosphohydrolase [Desulfomonilia bacterium]
MADTSVSTNDNKQDNNERILIVDDDPGILDTLTEMLSEQGFEILSARDGKEACALLDSGGLLCVLTDIMMPNMTGIELLKKVKEKDVSLPVIVITGHASIEMAIEAMKQGASDFITKPFKVKQIQYIINKVKREKLILEENRRFSEELQFHRMIDNLTEQIEDKSQEINSLQNMSYRITRLKGVHEIINAIIDLARELLSDSQVSFLPANQREGSLATPEGDIYFDDNFLKGHVLRKECTWNSSRGINTFFPLIIENQIFGVLSIKTHVMLSSDNEQKILYLLQRTAERMENVVLYQELYESILSTLYGMAKIMDARDPYTSQHSTRVTSISIMQADYLGLGEIDRDILYISSKLHDIGKVGIPDNILLKPTSLTDEEFAIIKKHPDIGADILKSISIMHRETEIIRHHHERYDGKGYPSGLKGDEIPLLSRIIALADTFDAMTSERPYRRALSTKEAIIEINRCKGAQFDPYLAESFIKVIDQY